MKVVDNRKILKRVNIEIMELRAWAKRCRNAASFLDTLMRSQLGHEHGARNRVRELRDMAAEMELRADGVEG